MAVPSNIGDTKLCSHCEREVPASNFDLHHGHCVRNLERCSVCGDMIPKRCATEHFEDTHAPVSCSQCGVSIERELLVIHERDKCLQRIVTCGYCEFPLPALELDKHLDTCGNRTEYCNPCGKYVRLCEKLSHDLQFHKGSSDGTGDSSSEREVPASNFDLHHGHCVRNLERCSVCGDMIPKSCATEHFQDTHAPVSCSQCGVSIERELLVIHERDKCLQRIVTCGYCEFLLPAVELDKHLDICGNRTEYCNPCGKYVTLCEKLAHDLQFHEGSSDGTGDSSREQHRESSRSSPPAEFSERVPRERRRDTSQRRWLVTLAITGVAIVIGSFVLQRRNLSEQQ